MPKIPQNFNLALRHYRTEVHVGKRGPVLFKYGMKAMRVNFRRINIFSVYFLYSYYYYSITLTNFKVFDKFPFFYCNSLILEFRDCAKPAQSAQFGVFRESRAFREIPRNSRAIQ